MEDIFIGREKELAKLNMLVNSPSPEFLVVYGRRRVGKTYLIRKFFKDRIVFEFTGTFEAPMSMQLDNFFNQYLYWSKEKYKSSPPQNWTIAFDYLNQLLRTMSRRKKVVVFIDELPWLDTPRSGFLSALEFFWNQHGSQMNNLLLVACGSAASWIHKKLLRAKGGLHNRVTQRMPLEPFKLAEVERYFHKKRLKFTRYQILQIYMVTGGVPFYLKEIRQGRSVDQIIDALCFSPDGLLSDEYNQLYYSLFKNAEDHMNLVEALALRPNGLLRSDLLRMSMLPDGGTFNRALLNLINCGFIASYQPFGKKKKDTVYRLIDMYSLFYLKFIQFNVSARPNTWQSLKAEGSFRPWSGYAFENIALIHIDEIHRALGVAGMHTKVSSWKFLGDKVVPGSQVDLIIDRKDDIIHLCEAKFTKNEFRLDKEYTSRLRQRRGIFEHASRSKKAIVTTLITTFPAFQNQYYHEEIHTEITMDDLFNDFLIL